VPQKGGHKLLPILVFFTVFADHPASLDIIPSRFSWVTRVKPI
jgi:hypothetical protein